MNYPRRRGKWEFGEFSRIEERPAFPQPVASAPRLVLVIEVLSEEGGRAFKIGPSERDSQVEADRSAALRSCFMPHDL